MKSDLYWWWAIRMLEGDYQAHVAMFRCGGVIYG